jgi:hypothetical protein
VDDATANARVHRLRRLLGEVSLVTVLLVVARAVNIRR